MFRFAARQHARLSCPHLATPTRSTLCLAAPLTATPATQQARPMPLSREDTCALGASAGAKALWGAFYDLSQIPRMSKHEAAVLSHITALAERHGLRHTRDAFGNVAVFRPGSGGGEGRAPVLVQAHVDMVCEKNDDKHV